MVNNHEEKYSKLMGIYAEVEEKVHGHAFYQSDPIYPPQNAGSTFNINGNE